MSGATGPLAGAILLFGNQTSGATPREIDRWLTELGERLGIYMGMQVIEDALCNWQKSPNLFVPFRG